MIIVAAVDTETPSLEGGAKTEPVGIAIVFLLFLFAFFYKPSWGATTWIWTSEIFSMNVRAQAVGMASQTQVLILGHISVSNQLQLILVLERVKRYFSTILPYISES